jgi:hypothetical protein
VKQRNWGIKKLLLLAREASTDDDDDDDDWQTLEKKSMKPKM